MLQSDSPAILPSKELSYFTWPLNVELLRVEYKKHLKHFATAQLIKDLLGRAVMGTHFATRVPAHQYPVGTRLSNTQWVPVYWVQHGYPGRIFVNRVVILHTGNRLQLYYWGSVSINVYTLIDSVFAKMVLMYWKNGESKEHHDYSYIYVTIEIRCLLHYRLNFFMTAML